MLKVLNLRFPDVQSGARNNPVYDLLIKSLFQLQY
jgi:hypothetical protein